MGRRPILRRIYFLICLLICLTVFKTSFDLCHKVCAWQRPAVLDCYFQRSIEILRQTRHETTLVSLAQQFSTHAYLSAMEGLGGCRVTESSRQLAHVFQFSRPTPSMPFHRLQTACYWSGENSAGSADVKVSVITRDSIASSASTLPLHKSAPPPSSSAQSQTEVSIQARSCLSMNLGLHGYFTTLHCA